MWQVFACFLLGAASAALGQGLEVEPRGLGAPIVPPQVPVDHANLRWQGRFETTEERSVTGMMFDHSGCRFRLRVRNTTRLQVLIDDPLQKTVLKVTSNSVAERITLTSTSAWVTIATADSLSTTLDVVVIKDVEPWQGETRTTPAWVTVWGFRGDTTMEVLEPTETQDVRVEFIGGGVIAGTGALVDEVPGAACETTPRNDLQSVDATFGAELCRRLDADCRFVGWTGAGFLYNEDGTEYPNTINHVLQRVLGTREADDNDWTAWVPDAVVFVFVENDVRSGLLTDMNEWAALLSTFIKNVHALYNKTPTLYLTCGPRTTSVEDYCGFVQDAVVARRDVEFQFFDLHPSTPTTGCDGYPTAAEAAVLLDDTGFQSFFLEKQGWTLASTTPSPSITPSPSPAPSESPSITPSPAQTPSPSPSRATLSPSPSRSSSRIPAAINDSCECSCAAPQCCAETPVNCSESSSNVGALVGIAVTLAVVMVLGVTGFMFMKKRKEETGTWKFWEAQHDELASPGSSEASDGDDASVGGVEPNDDVNPIADPESQGLLQPPESVAGSTSKKKKGKKKKGKKKKVHRVAPTGEPDAAVDDNVISDPNVVETGIGLPEASPMAVPGVKKRKPKAKPRAKRKKRPPPEGQAPVFGVTSAGTSISQFLDKQNEDDVEVVEEIVYVTGDSGDESGATLEVIEEFVDVSEVSPSSDASAKGGLTESMLWVASVAGVDGDLGDRAADLKGVAGEGKVALPLPPVAVPLPAPQPPVAIPSGSASVQSTPSQPWFTRGADGNVYMTQMLPPGAAPWAAMPLASPVHAPTPPEAAAAPVAPPPTATTAPPPPPAAATAAAAPPPPMKSTPEVQSEGEARPKPKPLRRTRSKSSMRSKSSVRSGGRRAKGKGKPRRPPPSSHYPEVADISEVDADVVGLPARRTLPPSLHPSKLLKQRRLEKDSSNSEPSAAL